MNDQSSAYYAVQWGNEHPISVATWIAQGSPLSVRLFETLLAHRPLGRGDLL
jgi:hypothetical protein